MSNYSATLEITFTDSTGTEHEGIKIEVTGTYIPGCRGHRDRYGAPEEPDEPAYIEVETAKLAQDVCRFDEEANNYTSEVLHHRGDDIDLNDEQQEQATNALDRVWYDANLPAMIAQAQAEEEAWRDCP